MPKAFPAAKLHASDSRPAVLNVHHLELFYYVARHGGISSAVRQMPYGIQQPAVSGQIAQLERHLGAKLFERQPFQLTATGRELLEFVEPFFSRLDEMEERLRHGPARPLRIAASEVVLRLHLPAVLERLRHHHGEVRLGLRSGFDTELAAWLRERQVDVIITPLHGPPPRRTRCLPLLRLPLALLVPKRWKLKSAEELWRQRRIDWPLISMPPQESISTIFQRELAKRGIQWPVTIEASSIELMTQYVADGRGAGVSVMLPEIVRHPRVAALPLAGFEMLEIAALWHGEPTPVLRAVLEEGQRYTRERWPDAIPTPGGDAAAAAGAGAG